MLSAALICFGLKMPFAKPANRICVPSVRRSETGLDDVPRNPTRPLAGQFLDGGECRDAKRFVWIDHGAWFGIRGPGEGEQPVVEVPAAFEQRCIPPDGVVRRLRMPNMRPPHALSGGRLAALGAPRGSTTGCEGAPDSPADGPGVTSESRQRSARVGAAAGPKHWRMLSRGVRFDNTRREAYEGPVCGGRRWRRMPRGVQDGRARRQWPARTRRKLANRGMPLLVVP